MRSAKDRFDDVRQESGAYRAEVGLREGIAEHTQPGLRPVRPNLRIGRRERSHVLRNVLWVPSDAAADASEVPDEFVFWLEMDQTGGTSYHNWLYFANANQPYRAYSIWNTFFEDYYTNTGDPRTPWADDPAEPFANAALSGYGQVPWSFQLKYTSRDDDMRLASGWEMRLLEAEAILEGAVAGDHLDAMALINQVRTRNVSDDTALPLAPWVAADATEAWTYLKRERSIELWLEGRRMGDERRWMENATPGTLDSPDWDGISPLFTERERSFCFDIPDSERDSNPNVPATTG